MYDKLKQDMITCMKEKKKLELSVIRMVKADCDRLRIDKKIELVDDVVMDVILKQIKMREDSILQFEKGGRSDLIEEAEKEIEVLKQYLPTPFSKEEVEEMITSAIEEVGAKTKKDMGSVMKIVSSKVKGRYDMKEVSLLIQEKLSEN